MKKYPINNNRYFYLFFKSGKNTVLSYWGNDKLCENLYHQKNPLPKNYLKKIKI